tara:strand:- start:251 stop:511 length:261 start_codon:yes stop_codon:yes gene_type:complete
MKAFAVKQIKRFFETGNWALKLIFIVVLAELTFVGGALIGLAGPLDKNDSDNIKHILSLVATKSFALYAAEKAGAKEKYLIEKAKT